MKEALLSELIGGIRRSFLEELKASSSSKDLEALKVKYFGKKGSLAGLMIELKDCSPEERPRLGKLVNDLKEELSLHCEGTLSRIKGEELEKQFEKEWLDATLPGKSKSLGRKHPLSQMLERVIDILVGMGFAVRLGPDVDTDYYNFEGLNFAKDHPARDMQDTFYVGNEWLLRTHTSNVQVHVMEENAPPIRVIAPGRCFRNEDVSARSHVFFHQVEGFYIDRGVTFADLMATMEEFLSKLLGQKAKTRFRPSYFPFVEPGLEVDVACTRCHGAGCRICKHTGWLEVLGSGMIHPKVLQKGNIDPEIYTGYAWGMGIERLAMLFFDVPDIRMFTENDMRFLQQFP
ncbi:MAG TPA: phenylalanine--tRNA ligase subunit alpha [Chlamydiales bacterium]